MKTNKLFFSFKILYNCIKSNGTIWRSPHNLDVLIFDCASEVDLQPYLIGFEWQSVSVRGEHVYAICLIRSVFTKKFWTIGPSFGYLMEVIRSTNPKIVITLIDTSSVFYCLASEFPRIKFVAIQNGHRDFSALPLFCTHGVHVPSANTIMTFNDSVAKCYTEVISTNTMTIGSFRSNATPITQALPTRNIVFVSQVDIPQNPSDVYIRYSDGHSINWHEFIQDDINVLKFLDEWCFRNNYKLLISGRTVDAQVLLERHFYGSVLTLCDWEFLARNSELSTYEMIDRANFVIGIDSTVLYESLGRGNKTVFFSIRGSDERPNRKFGFPMKFAESGDFWTNQFNVDIFEEILQRISTTNRASFIKNNQYVLSNIIGFDKDNSIFVKLLSDLV